MALKYTSIVFAGCCHLVASQTATSWPPSTSVPAAISKIGLVPACSGTATPPHGAGTIPQYLFSGIQADLNNQNSEISQMIQATCDKGYASKHQQYGSCNADVCTFAASTPEYNASYTTNTFSGNLDFCLGAPFFIAQHCAIASGNTPSPVGGSYASNFNGGGSENFQSYTFAIKPSGLPFPQCTGDQFQTNEQANVLLAIQSICAADACKLPGEQFGCDRNITQADYVIQAHRQNYGTNDFSNCATAMESIVGSCYEKGQGGGTWALQGQASQEYYTLFFQPPPPAPLTVSNTISSIHGHFSSNEFHLLKLLDAVGDSIVSAPQAITISGLSPLDDSHVEKYNPSDRSSPSTCAKLQSMRDKLKVTWRLVRTNTLVWLPTAVVWIPTLNDGGLIGLRNVNFTEGELYNSVFLQLKAVVYVGFIKGLGRSFYVRLKVGSSNFPDEFEPEVIKLDPSRDTETTEQGPKPGVLRDIVIFDIDTFGMCWDAKGALDDQTSSRTLDMRQRFKQKVKGKLDAVRAPKTDNEASGSSLSAPTSTTTATNSNTNIGNPSSRALSTLQSSPTLAPTNTTATQPVSPITGSLGSLSVQGQAAITPKARDLWAIALGKLTDEEKAAVPTNSSDFKLQTLEDLRIVVVRKRDECEDKSWKFEIRGRQIVLRDVAEKIIYGINKFKEIGDVAVNFDPVHAALPWAGVRFLLQIAVVESQQMGAILIGVEKVAYLIDRCGLYEILYLQRAFEQAETNLESALVTLYSHLLRFLALANRFYKKNNATRAGYGILNPNEFASFVEESASLEKRVDCEAHICESTYNRDMNVESVSRAHELKRLLIELKEPIMRIDSRVAAMFRNLNSNKQSDILRWISSIPYEDNHKTARKGRTEETGEWLLNHEQYRDWRGSSASMILWLHGFPGAGKTKLVSTVIDDLLESSNRQSHDEALAYFYCDRNQSDRRDPALILTSFIRQLSLSKTQDSIQHSIVQLYNKKQQSGFASGLTDTEEIENSLLELVLIYPQITLIVDALDECNKQTRAQFVGLLNRLIHQSPKLIKIFVSSRPDRDIKYCFEKGPNVMIKATDNHNDIAKFIDHRIASSPPHWPGRKSSDLNKLIVQTLMDKCQGMFQWASLQIEYLLSLSLERDIRNRLGKLPKTLKDAYDEIYGRIQAQEGSAPDIANRAFQWIMCSIYPLSPAELMAAVCQDPESDAVETVYVNLEFVLESCHNLLVVDQTQVCRFSHLSVQEYFEIHHWNQSNVNGLVAKVCLLMLNDPIQQKQPGRRPEGAYEHRDIRPVLEYARRHWMTHVKKHGEEAIDSRLTRLLMDFLGSMNESGPAYRYWCTKTAEMGPWNREQTDTSEETENLETWDEQRWSEGTESIRNLKPYSLASLPIAFFGFYKVLSEWWTIGFNDVEQTNMLGISLLMLAVESGNISTVSGLLEKGAKVNAQRGCEALHFASFYKHEEHEDFIKLLLQNGIDVNAKGGHYDYGNALQTASIEGYKDIVKLLLEHDADVNAQGGQYGNALQAASIGAHKDIVKLLLEHDAEVNAQIQAKNVNEEEWIYRNALHAAVSMKRTEVVELLVEYGAIEQ